MRGQWSDGEGTQQVSTPPPPPILVGCSSPFMTRRTHHGASCLVHAMVHAMSVWSVKTRRAPFRHSRDARVIPYGHTATVMLGMSTPPPPLRSCRFVCLASHLKVDIVVATPGRLLDHLEKTPGFTLQHLRYLVIDEADRLLNQSYQGWVEKVIKAAHRCGCDDFGVYSFIYLFLFVLGEMTQQIFCLTL